MRDGKYMFKVKVIKTPLQESVDEIQEWQQSDKWEQNKTEKSRKFDFGYIPLAGLAISGLGMLGLTIYVLIINL
jgi:hypothetical protein